MNKMSKQSRIPVSIRQFLRSSIFWRDNYFLLGEVRNFPRIVAIALVFTFIGASLEGLTIGLIAAFIQGLTNPGEPPIQTGIGWFDNWLLATKASAQNRILRLSLLLLLMTWLRSGFFYVGAFYSRVSELKILDGVRRQLFEQFQKLSLSYYSSISSGSLIDVATNQLNQVKQALTDFSDFIIRGSTLIAYVLAMFVISWQLSVVTMLLYTLLSVVLTRMARKTREQSFAIPKADGALASVIVEMINGIRTIKASAAQDFERKRFYRASSQVVEAGRNLYAIAEMTKPLAEAAATTILLVMVVASFLVLINNNKLQAASLLTFMFVLFRMMPLVSQLNTFRSRLQQYQGSIHSIRELLRRDDKPYLSNGTRSFTGLKHSIDFVSIDFAYSTGKQVLYGVTLSIPRGATIALVGASGAGKTTLADLIPRFYDPIHGKVLIDGSNIRDFEINSLRRRMSVVSQDTFIFNTSIRNNIAYGLEDISELAIHEAAHLANAFEFIQDLPEGFDTVLGDRGVRLSGGQRQRIAIARALLRNPEILILDEATSALDSVSEGLIQESLEQLSKGRTVIAIAHRLSTISGADKVVVLERGQIVEQGNYQELLDQRGALWKYHQVQYSTEQVVDNAG